MHSRPQGLFITGSFSLVGIWRVPGTMYHEIGAHSCTTNAVTRACPVDETVGVHTATTVFFGVNAVYPSGVRCDTPTTWVLMKLRRRGFDWCWRL